MNYSDEIHQQLNSLRNLIHNHAKSSNKRCRRRKEVDEEQNRLEMLDKSFTEFLDCKRKSKIVEKCILARTFSKWKQQLILNLYQSVHKKSFTKSNNNSIKTDNSTESIHTLSRYLTSSSSSNSLSDNKSASGSVSSNDIIVRYPDAESSEEQKIIRPLSPIQSPVRNKEEAPDPLLDSFIEDVQTQKPNSQLSSPTQNMNAFSSSKYDVEISLTSSEKSEEEENI